MNKTELTTTARVLEDALGKEGVTALGYSTGFARRLREVTPHRLVVALIGALAGRRVRFLADVLRTFNALNGRSLCYKPFHNQLAKAEFPLFMKAVFEQVLARLVHRVIEPLPGEALGRFEDILIHDGTSFAVDKHLCHTFPGRFTQTHPASIEIHATMSVLRDDVVKVTIAADSVSERALAPVPDSLKGKLLLADRGYSDVAYCGAIDRAGGYFLFQFRYGSNPTVTGCIVKGRVRQDLVGRKLNDVLARCRGRDADLDVEWNRGGTITRVRLILLRRQGRVRQVMLGTNLDREDFSASVLAQLYRLRWQIELVFKQWKSYTNLHGLPTKKPGIVEGLIWATLTASMVKRYFAHATEQVFINFEASTHRTAMSIGQHLPAVLRAMLTSTSLKPSLRKMMRFLYQNAARAHPRRDRTIGRFRSPLRPVRAC